MATRLLSENIALSRDVWGMRVDQSIHRVPMSKELAPCVCAHSKIVAAKGQSIKLLSAQQIAGLQGLGPCELRKFRLANVKSALLKDLAGNSFSTNSVFVALLEALAWRYAEERRLPKSGTCRGLERDATTFPIGYAT